MINQDNNLLVGKANGSKVGEMEMVHASTIDWLFVGCSFLSKCVVFHDDHCHVGGDSEMDGSL